MSIDRGRILHQLILQYDREKTINLADIKALANDLTPEEQKRCSDSIVLFKVESLRKDKKVLIAYSELVAGMKESPLSIGLQNQMTELLAEIEQVYIYWVINDLLNPIVELLYEIQLKNGTITPNFQAEFLRYLVGHRRYAEAATLARPLVALYPSLMHLRETVTVIAEHAPHEDLLRFIQNPPVKLGRKIVSEPPTRDQFKDLVRKFQQLEKSVLGDDPIEPIEKDLNEIIGPTRPDDPMNIYLKEFYYLKAIVEERKENYLESMFILRDLVEMDPCNLDFKNLLDTEFRVACRDIRKKDDAGNLNLDLVKLYPVLREIGLVSHNLLRHVCLAEVKKGLEKEARSKIKNLIALNPLDLDFVCAGLIVADALQDSAWEEELYSLFEPMRIARPWDLRIPSP